MKEILISDIDILEPEQDQQYSDNIVRNLLGNYYFFVDETEKKNYLFSLNNTKKDKKISLINNINDAIVSWVKSGANEIVTIKFLMSEWNKSYSQIKPQNKSDLETAINNNLKDLYYYGLSKNVNGISPANKDYLTKQFGKYFYDYCFAMQTPKVITANDDPLTVSLQAKIEPIYNFYDADFEKVASTSKESSLYNFYALYYYLQEKLEDPVKKDFLQNNVLPLLQKYDTFVESTLPTEILSKLYEFRATNPPEADKKTIIVKGEALKAFNDIESKKAEQPYGIEVSFNPSPQKVLGNLFKGTSGISDLESFVTDPLKFDFLKNKNFFLEIKDGEPNTEMLYDPPVVSLNDWIKTLEAQEIKPTSTNIIFSKKLDNKDSMFLKSIKKVLLQKKIISLIQSKKRSFMDIVAGVPAYNEVVLYQIIKSNDKGQALQTILVPNTENIDLYKYFDTQVKYDTKYNYEVTAWTLVIGNKYKFFDRVEVPPKKVVLTQLKNSDSEDSEFFRWFRVANLFSKLFTSGKNLETFLNENTKTLGETSEKLPNQTTIIPTFNFSKALFNTYSANIYGNSDYNSLLNTENFKSLADELIRKVAKSFSIKFTDLLTTTFTSITGPDVTNAGIIYETFRTQTGDLPLDILSSAAIKKPYYSKSVDYENALYEVIKIFNKVGILPNLNLQYLQSLVAEYGKAVESGVQSEKNLKYLRIADYLEKNFFRNIDLFIEGGFIKKESEVDLNVEPNFGLDKNSQYYPRFYTKEKTNNTTIEGQLQFGVYNETDIVLIGIPYVIPETKFVNVVSYPPPPPDVLPVPYKNVSNRIKFFLNDSFFTYRDKPIEIISPTDGESYKKILVNEKYKDGKITFKGDESSSYFFAYRLDKKPSKYTDFEAARVSKLENKGGFEDSIEPNKKYYYTFRSVDSHDMPSNPSAIYEIEIVQNSGTIYPIVNIVELEQEDPRTKIKSIKERFKINVNNQRHILLREGQVINNKNISTFNVDIFGMDKDSQNSVFNKTFKIRITSKSSKKKIDINLVFNKDIDKNYLQALKQIFAQQAKNAVSKIKPNV